MGMTREELREAMLKVLHGGKYDPEIAHYKLDELLLEYIDDKEVSRIFNETEKWYA